MTNVKKQNKVLVYSGAAALAAIAFNVAIFFINAHRRRKKRKGLLGSSVRVNLSAKEINALADEIIAESKETHDLVASIPLEKVTYTNAILPIAELEAKQFPLIQSCIFPKMISIVDDVRRASVEAEKKIDSHFLMCRKREDVYRVVKAFVDKGEWLNLETKCFIECLIRDFQRNGVFLNLSQKKKMENLKSQIESQSLQYIKNLNEDCTILLFNEPELAGMPLEFIKSLEKTENGKLKVSLRSNHVSPILEYCKVGDTRKLVSLKYGQRCGNDNLHILENLVQSRHQYAQLLGYASYADYAIEPRMAKSSAKVFEFLDELSHNLTDLAKREFEILKDLKRKEEGESPFGIEDTLYYMKRAEEKYLDADSGVVNQMFPVNLVVDGIFRTYQELFGLKFDEIDDVEVWHDSVHIFSVSDVSCNELLGYFYFDMFPREGKYTHTCVLALQNGCSISNTTRQVPIALLLSQLPKQSNDSSGVLKFSEVVSLFHEFGHVIHQLCNRASFSRLSGLRIESDFFEIPGFMLENWCYESSSLRLLSGFNQENAKPISSEMCRILKKRRDSFSGLKLKQEIFLCVIDQIIHSSENVDIVDLVKHLHPKVMLGIPILEGTNPASCYPCLAVGHEASCYAYLWSEVFSADIFSSKFQDDLMNQHAGLQFRNKVFAPGGAKDPFEILTEYLGREPSIHAYIEMKTRNSLGYNQSPLK